MPSNVAALVYWSFILLLFYLDWRQNPRTSNALWVPLIYFFLIASRPVSMWLDLGGAAHVSQVEDGSPVDRLVYFVLLALAVVILLQRQTRVQRLLRGQGPLVLFVGYCLVSIIWSDFPVVAFKRWIKLLTDVLMVLVVVTDPRPMDAVKRFLARSAFVLIPLSVLFIKYYPHLGHGYDSWSGDQMIQGVSYNKNGMGAICLFWGAGYAWIFLETIGKKTRQLMDILPVACLLTAFCWLLVLTNSKTSLACFLMGIFLLAWTRNRFVQRYPLLFHIPATAMISTAAVVLFLGIGGFALEAVGRDATLTDRTDVWEKVLNITGNSVLGTGYESFWLGDRLDYLWSIYWWQPNQAHNGYIELYINLGWVGVALFVSLLCVAYMRISAEIRSGNPYASLRLSWIVIGVVYNFTEASFRMQNPAWIFTLFALAGAPQLLGERVRVKQTDVRTKWSFQSRVSTNGSSAA